MALQVVVQAVCLRRYVNDKGRTHKACPVCGKFRVNRVSVRLKYSEPNALGQYVSMVNVCFGDCMNKFFITSPVAVLISAGKVIPKYSHYGVCSRCKGDALGGVWVSSFPRERVRMHRGGAPSGSVYMLCPSCFTQRGFDGGMSDERTE